MQNTVNLNLKKPDQNDFVNIGDINDNMDTLDAEVAKKYVKPLAGIPFLDLDSATQAALKKAETALQTVTKSSVGLGNVDNTSDVNKPVSTAQQVALDKKANLASPSLTGTPTAPTAAESTNTQQIATTAFVNRAVKTHQADLASHGLYGTATGTNTLAMAVTLDSSVTSYPTGMLVAFKNTSANTGAVSLNINSLGAKSIKKANGNNLVSGNLKAGGVYQVRYDGSNFILLGEGGEYGTAVASDVLTGKTIGTDNGLVTGTMPNRETFNLPLGASVPAGYYSGGTVPNGKRWTSGILTSSVGTNVFSNTDGNSLSSPYVTLTSLAFTPSKIILKHNSLGLTIWSYDDLYYRSPSERANVMTHKGMWYRVSYTTPMNIPVTYTNTNYEWIAYE